MTGTGEHVATEACIDRIKKSMPRRHRNRADALHYIELANRAGLVCLDCGSENHTRGNYLCNAQAKP